MKYKKPLFAIISKTLPTLLIFTLIFRFIAISWGASLVSAADNLGFTLTDKYRINYQDGDDFVTINDTLTIEIGSAQYYLPAGSTQTFTIPDFDSTKEDYSEVQFKKESLVSRDSNGKIIEHAVSEDGENLIIDISIPKDITHSSPFTVELEYKTHQLSNLNGNIVNLYIPGLPETAQFERIDESTGLITKMIYETSLAVSENSPEASYIQPESVTTKSEDDKRIYSINQEDRVGQTAWIQLGTEQYYYFKIVQKANKTDNLIPPEVSSKSDLLSTNVYRIPLPKDNDETNQRVYFKSITPKPAYIERDKEGNLTAIYEVPANQDSSIEVEGYMRLESSMSNNEIPDISLNEYFSQIANDKNFDLYREPGIYWEINDPVVQEKALELLADKETLLELIEADYQYIVDSFEYSHEKVNSENPRLGSVAALTGSQAVCMEYADATIALLRAQGIAARAAVGYGNDPTGAENEFGSGEANALVQKIGHQWVQIWVPEYGWLSIDPTWGESGRKYIGSNLDHLLWFTAGDGSKDFEGTLLNSANRVSHGDLESYTVYISALPSDQFPEEESLTSLTELMSSYKDVKYDKISFFLKTTTVGKAIVVTTPVCVSFILIAIVMTVLIRLLKRASRKGNS